MPPYVDDACVDLTIDAEWDKMRVCYTKSETNEQVCYTITQDEPPPPPPPLTVIESDELPIIESNEITANTTTEVCKVLEEWTSDEESSVDLDIMEVDEKIGADFLNDDLFDGGVAICPQDEYANATRTDNEDERRRRRVEEAFRKLSEMMRKSQESRVALTMKTMKTTENEKYAKEQNVSTVLSEIEKSRTQLHNYFGHPASAGA